MFCGFGWLGIMEMYEAGGSVVETAPNNRNVGSSGVVVVVALLDTVEMEVVVSIMGNVANN